MIDLANAVVLGIDPSMTATGIAQLRAGVWTFATIRTSKEDGRIERRWDMVLAGVDQLAICGAHPVFCAIEEYPWLMLKLGARGAGDRLGLRALLLHRLYSRGVSTVEVSATAVKALAGGGEYNKRQMVAAAREEGAQVRDSHQADAYWIARWLIERETE